MTTATRPATGRTTYGSVDGVPETTEDAGLPVSCATGRAASSDAAASCGGADVRALATARDEWPAAYWLPHGRGVVGLLAHGAIVVRAMPVRRRGCRRWEVTVSACGVSASPLVWGSLRSALRCTRYSLGEDCAVVLCRLIEREPVPWHTVAAVARTAAEVVP